MDEEDDNKEDCYVEEFNLGDNSEAVIGFKGTIGKTFESLGFYKATRSDCKIDKSAIKSNKKSQKAMRLESNVYTS